MVEERVHRRLAAILAADVVGYSRLMLEDEAGTRARFNAHLHELIEPAIASRRGRIVKTTGDGLLVEFASVVHAVQCAAEIQNGLAERNADEPEDQRMVFRIGVNLGDVIVEGDDIHGDGVNVAARLEGLCKPGEVYVSGTVHDHVASKLSAAFDDLGEQTVKNITKPVRVFRVREKSGEAVMMPDRSDPAPPLSDKPSIAVLPFENMSGDPEQDYFADGIAEDIITGLSKFHWFFVIARNSSFTYRGRAVNVTQVGHELGVQYVLEGSVRRVSSQVRITAQLVDATTANHVWAERYDRKLEDIFAVQDEITEKVIGAVAPEFISAEARRVGRKLPGSLDAWDYTIRANWHLWRLSKEDVAQARGLFHQAIERDSNSAIAYSGLATAHAVEGQFGWAASPKETEAAAIRAAQNAIAVDDHDAAAHAAFGFVNVFARQFDAAIGALRRALDLNPNLAIAEGHLGLALAFAGELDEAVPHIDMAMRLSPRDPVKASWFITRALVDYLAGRYDEAAEWARRTIDARPDFPPGWRMLAASTAMAGSPDDAQTALQELLRLAPETTLETTRSGLPIRHPEHMELYLEGLRKAGLPEG